MTYASYNHHGVDVWVRSDLQGKHREHCLCFRCSRLNIDDREKKATVESTLRLIDMASQFSALRKARVFADLLYSYDCDHLQLGGAG